MFQNPLLSPLHAPLGLPLTEEVPAVHLDVNIPEEIRRQFDIPATRPSLDQFNRNLDQYIPKSGDRDTTPVVVSESSMEFDPDREETKVKLSHSLSSLTEPLKCMIEALEYLDSEGGMERLLNTPSILDFFPDELRRQAGRSSMVAQGTLDTIGDLGSDSFYATKKTENVDSSTAVSAAPAAPPEASPVATTPEVIEDVPVVAPTTVVKTSVTEGLSVAHSPCAYDLSGSLPWASYTTDTFTPLSPMDIRYHRVHICSPNLDKPSNTWTVVGPKQSHHLESPPDGSCAFKTTAHLSLRDKGPFILFESIEQNPLLMHFHGMSGSIFRYWRPRHGSASTPDPDQLQALGKFGQLTKLDTDQHLPRAYGGTTIKVDSHCCVLESSLIRAPLFSHKPNQTDFVLVRSRQPRSGGQLMCVLRPIENIFCMGQSEPLYRIDVPVVPRLHQSLSSRVMLECRRFWLKAKSMPRIDFVNHVFIGERKSLLHRYLADSIRDIQQRPTAPLSSPISPEEACVVNSMKEGIRRLAERGIERIFAISPMRIANYVRDVEIFERTIPPESRTPRIAHYCVQLENEMRLSTWNLTNDYWDVMTSKRAAIFQFSPLGDPSGGRGEGLSYRKVLKIDGVSAEAALSSLLLANKKSSSVSSSAGPSLSMDALKLKPKRELVAELQKMNVPERVWKTMSRWQLMRQLALLLGIEDDSEDRLAPWKRKALHSDRINDAWRKQTKALADRNPPAVSALEFRKASEAFSLTTSELGITIEDDSKSQDSGSEDESSKKEKGLEELMMDELMGDDEDMDVKEYEQDEDEKELGLLRGGQPTETVVEKIEEVNSSPQITRLQIVSVGRAKSTGHPWSKVTYVYGERNIALYRKWKEIEEMGVPNQSQAATPAASPSSWQSKVEMSLKVHRRFQRILKQAAEAGQPIPDIKRCSACHLFGHDSSYEGCPMLVREMNESVEVSGRKRKADTNQSPVYD